MTPWARIVHHARLTWRNYAPGIPASPPFLSLFTNSICNQACEHCFYWRNPNRPDDLIFDRLARLSGRLGRGENLNLSGGEPFLREEFGEVCRMFIRNNGVRQIYVPTNGSVADKTSENIDEIRRPTGYLYGRRPAMDHRNTPTIRGDRKSASLQGFALKQYKDLYDPTKRLWRPRESGRYGAVVEPMLQTAKKRTATERRQVVPWLADNLTGVVYSDRAVSVRNDHASIGNRRERSFMDIRHSQEAQRFRRSIAAKQCHCTNEVFLWPGIVYRPPQLAKIMMEAKVRRKPLGPQGDQPPASANPPAASNVLH